MALPIAVNTIGKIIQFILCSVHIMLSEIMCLYNVNKKKYFLIRKAVTRVLQGASV